jgi:2-dehydropantoate 2-reductase
MQSGCDTGNLLMRICIVGAGAIGGLLAVRLSLAGIDVSVIERGTQLGAIRSKGLRLIEQDGSVHHVEGLLATDDFTLPGLQDFVILALKAHQIVAVAPQLEALCGEHTAIVTVQNGLPWWYFQNHPGEHRDRRLNSLDPDGMLAASVPALRIVGCVAYPASAVVEPGVVRLVEGNRFTVGEPDGSTSERCTTLARTLVQAGFKSFAIEDIRAEIWLKAWGALSFNTLSALTGATMAEICREPASRALVGAMMREAQEIAGKLGVQIRHSIERRIEGAEKVGAHKTSMLQDVEAGREMEVGAVIGSIVELAGLTRTAAPTIDSIHACCVLLNQRLRQQEKQHCR